MSYIDHYREIQNEISRLYPDRTVCIIAVSKKHSYETFAEAYREGIRDFGENSVQEGLSKIEMWRADNPHLAFTIDEPRIHHIGPVQKGTLRKLFGNFVSTHGVGSLNAWKELSKRSIKEKATLSCFFQLNLTREDTKSGFLSGELLDNREEIQSLTTDRLVHEGFMTMGPSNGDPDTTRQVFREMKEFRDKYFPGKKLSMGMSGDYLTAVGEGSDMVRIGTAIFGERNYHG